MKELSTHTWARKENNKMSEHLLEVKSISGGYNDLTILRNINLHISYGEIVCIVGANGAGKTTLMRILSGLQKPTEGQVIFRGSNITDYSAAKVAKAGISLVPEDRKIFTEMTVRENLELGVAYFKNAQRKKEETLEFVYHIFPVLKDRAEQMAGTMSGGEQQMLTIARALMACPQLLLVDEPSLGLAPVIVKSVFRALEKVKQQGLAILIVEQDVNLSLSFSSRGYVMENGHIVVEGAREELLSNEMVKSAYLGG
jgi:branched-chain amino acid transport system ATP-binding protein